MKKILVLLVLFSLTCFNQVFAAIIIPPTDDAFTQNTLPTNNFGVIHTNLIVGTLGAIDRSYLKFDLSSYVDSGISAARLYLFKTSGTGASTISAYSTSSAWTEGALTWNNQPSLPGTPVNTSVGASNNLWFSWDVTSFAKNAAGDYLSLGLATTSNVSKTFRSSENTAGNTPYLELTYTPPAVVPEPGSMALLGIGLIGVITRRLRRKSH